MRCKWLPNLSAGVSALDVAGATYFMQAHKQ